MSGNALAVEAWVFHFQHVTSEDEFMNGMQSMSGLATAKDMATWHMTGTSPETCKWHLFTLKSLFSTVKQQSCFLMMLREIHNSSRQFNVRLSCSLLVYRQRLVDYLILGRWQPRMEEWKQHTKYPTIPIGCWTRYKFRFMFQSIYWVYKLFWNIFVSTWSIG